MDRRMRVGVQVLVLVVLLASLGFQSITAGAAPSDPVRVDGGAYPGETLITVQSHGWFSENNGKAFIVNESGTVRWEFDPPNSRVFDAEAVGDGHILVAFATNLGSEDCPEEHTTSSDGCVKNRVVEIDRDTDRVVWNYSWYDAFIEWHEVHDVDRLSSGETAIVDMGNNRAFTVNRSGEITWTWSAEKYLGPGSEFWAEHIPEDRRSAYRKDGPESDWTHMNDIDHLENGLFQLSIRNFDVVITVDPETKEVVDVVGSPGNTDIINEQHDPNRIEHAGTLLVADSKNDRIVELDASTGETIWVFEGANERLRWPRDADRLPNGNTLITDSRNFRILEVNESGTIVWQYALQDERGIVYDADRLGLPEEPDDVPSARTFDRSYRTSGGVLGMAVSWARFVLPVWIGVPELIAVVAAVLVALGLVVEGVLFARDRMQ